MEQKIINLNPKTLVMQDFNPSESRTSLPSLKTGLLQSVKSHGIIEPIKVYKKGNKYHIADGHRRTTCAIHLGLEEVPCLVYSEELLPLLYGECARTKKQLNGAETLSVWLKAPQMLSAQTTRMIDKLEDAYGHDVLKAMKNHGLSYRFLENVNRAAKHYGYIDNQEWKTNFVKWMMSTGNCRIAHEIRQGWVYSLDELNSAVMSGKAYPPGKDVWTITKLPNII